MKFEVGKFKIKPGKEDLCKDDFDFWPAWSEHYDYDEIDDIVAWGIDREWALSRFSEYDTGEAHPHYTILDMENLPLNNIRIFLKATFIHPGGQQIDGYIMNKGELVITLFSDSNEYTFSNHPMLQDMVEKTRRKAEGDLGMLELFPLRFVTEFNDENGAPIQGIYDLKNNDVPNNANSDDANSHVAD